VTLDVPAAADAARMVVFSPAVTNDVHAAAVDSWMAVVSAAVDVALAVGAARKSVHGVALTAQLSVGVARKSLHGAAMQLADPVAAAAH